MLRGMICPVIPAVIGRVAEMGPDDVMLDIWSDLQIPTEAKASRQALENLLFLSERIVSGWFRGPRGIPDLNLLCWYDLSQVFWSVTHPGLVLICADPFAEGGRGEHVHIRHIGAVFETSSESGIKRLIETVERWGNIFGELGKMFPEGRFSLVAMRGRLKAEGDVQEAKMEKGEVSIRVSRNRLEVHAPAVTKWKNACIKHPNSFLS